MKQQRIEVLLELISCNQPLFYWRYDEQGNLLYSDCPAEKMLDVVLRRTGGLRCIYEMGHNAPLLIGADSSLLWIADRENLEGKGLFQIHVLGPFFSHEHGVAGIEEMTRQVVAQASPQWANAFLEVARALPTLSLPFYSQYAVMLHYLLSGEKIPTSSLDYQIEMQPVPADFSNLKKHTPPKDRLQTYRAERALLNAVREGDMDCADTMEIASSVAKVREYTDNQLRNVQIACTTFATQGKKQRLISLKNIHSVLERNEMEAWQKLIRVLTHEIMNSITPIISLSETLSERGIPESLGEKEYSAMLQAMQTIHRRSKGLLGFVENYRRLTRIPIPVRTKVSVAELFMDLKKLFPEEYIHFEMPASDLFLYVDRAQIEQVLINLLKNARETCERKIDKEIQIKFFSKDNPTLTISDNGEGILTDVLDKIFVPFFTTKTSGSGIGLSLCKQIMTLHDGSINVKSEIGKGSCFILTFPK